MATCLFPLRMPHAVVPCGRCNICRHNVAQDWVARLMVESQADYKAVYFLTLTYSCAPISGLQKSDVQRWLKRVRKKCKVRFFAVGEYGSRYGRPHYHVILFLKSGKLDDVVSAWTQEKGYRGYVDVGKVTIRSCAYVAGYALKSGRWPVTKNKPFRLMSRKPGIGDSLLTPQMRKYYIDSLSTELWLEGKLVRLPRFYRKKLFGETDAKKIADRNLQKHFEAQDHLVERLKRLGYRDPLVEIEVRRKAYNDGLSRKRKTVKL